MKLIVGLGNPGEQYEGTPHNLGFDVLDDLAASLNVRFNKKVKYKGVYAEAMIGDELVVLLKPQTFMNNSGDAVFAYLKKCNLQPKDVLVVLDDCELSPGLVRARTEGTGGTHNGLKHVVMRLGTTEFARVRIGVGEPPNDEDYAKFVLSKIPGSRLKNVYLGVEKAQRIIIDWVMGKDISTTI